MSDEVEKLNEWLDEQISLTQSSDWAEYLRGLKDIDTKSEFEICQTMYSYKSNPVLDYLRTHKSDYEVICPSPTSYWITGSGTYYVRKS